MTPVTLSLKGDDTKDEQESEGGEEWHEIVKCALNAYCLNRLST